MNLRLDIDWVRAHVEGRLSASERAAFERRLEREPELADCLDRYAEVAAWPTEALEPSSVRFEDLALDDAPIAPSASRRVTLRRVATAAAVLLPLLGGYVLLSRRTPSEDAASRPVVLEAIRAATTNRPGADAPARPMIPALAETYLPVGDQGLRFAADLDVARRLGALAGRPTVAFVQLDGCPACAELKKTTFRDRRVLDVAAGFVFATVSAKVIGTSLEIPSGMGLDKIEGWPLFAVFDANGTQIDAFGGMLDAEEFAARLSRHLGSTAEKPAAWAAVHAAARVLRQVGDATPEGAEFALLSKIDLDSLTQAVARGVQARLASIGDAAREELRRALGANQTMAITELDRAITRFAGSPFEGDFRRVRDRVLSDRKFPPLLEYPK